MTTRRRRAGSDSVPPELNGQQLEHQQQQQLQDQQQHNTLTNNPVPLVPTLVPVLPTAGHTQGFGLGWTGAGGGLSTIPQQAYYKKTDAPLPCNINTNNTTSLNIFPDTNICNNIYNYPYPNSNNYQQKQNLIVNPQQQHNYPSESSQGVYSSSGGIIGQDLSSSRGFRNTGPELSSGASLDLGRTASEWRSDSLLGSSDLVESSVGDEHGGMASRDRTGEFAGIIRSQQGHASNGGLLLQQTPSRPVKDLEQYSYFMKRSRLVGRNISSTYAKLEKLTHLARKRSLFDDSQDVEVQELTAIIRHDLGSLTKQLDELRRASASSTVSPATSNNHLHKHSANLVGSLQSRVAGITQQFRDVLEVRTENLKKQAERRDQFTSSSVGGSGAPAGVGHHTASVLLADEAKAAAAARRNNALNRPQQGGDVVVNFDGVSSSDGGGAYQQQLQLMEEQDSLLVARAETMKTIESTIVELGTMFTQLASMVKEQDELVHRIDANVDDAELNIEGAHTELLRYFRNVSSNRWLMLKVFGIVIFFFVIFIVFMA